MEKLWLNGYNEERQQEYEECVCVCMCVCAFFIVYLCTIKYTTSF